MSRLCRSIDVKSSVDIRDLSIKSKDNDDSSEEYINRKYSNHFFLAYTAKTNT